MLCIYFAVLLKIVIKLLPTAYLINNWRFRSLFSVPSARTLHVLEHFKILHRSYKILTLFFYYFGNKSILLFMVETSHFKWLFRADICAWSLFICFWLWWRWSFLFGAKEVPRSRFITGSVSLISWSKGLRASEFIAGSLIGEISWVISCSSM